jgi:ABC-type transport system substrate-binding protein
MATSTTARALALQLVAAALVIAGCAAPAPQAPTAPQVTEAQAKAAPGRTEHQCEAGKEEWRSPGAPKRGGTLLFAQNPFDHLDPSTPGRLAPMSQVYNGLLEYRACFYGDYSAALKLARSWQVSPDAQTWTFQLRDGVTWQNIAPVNGRPFTSADVAWTIDHQKKAGLLKTFWQDVTYEIPSPSTIVLRLGSPDADFLGKVTDHRNLILPREVQEQKGDFKSVAIGTGAFLMKEVKPRQETVLERRPNYWEQGADGQPLPYLDAVRNLVFADPAAQVAAFRSGQLDHNSASNMTAAEADSLVQSNPKLQRVLEVFPAVFTVYFNHKRENSPFRDERVRKAVGLAIDREEIIVSAKGGVYGGFVPPYLWEWAWPQAKLKERGRADVAAAKRLLESAGVAPSTIKTSIKTASNYRQEAEIVQQHLAAIGIQATVDVDQGATFTPILQKADFDIAWGAYPGSAFPNFWVGDFIRSKSTQNFLGINDTKVDELVAAHAKELDGTKRRALLDQLQERLYEFTPYVPVVSHYYNHVTSCRLKNARRTLTSYNNPMVLAAWLDPTGC